MPAPTVRTTDHDNAGMVARLALVERLRAEVLPLVLPLIRAGAGSVLAKANAVAGDVVTDVDHAVEAVLAGRLPALLPGSRFIGEESFTAIADPGDGPLWIADPLDGTINFVAGISCFGTSIALLEAGVPVLALVVDATTGTVWDAVAGAGARRDGVTFRHDPARAAAAPLSVSSGTLLLDAETPGLGLMALLRRTSPRLRILGSQALQLCYVAEGRLRIVINRETRLWDDAAGWLVCREAGAAHALAAGVDLFPLAPGGFAARGEPLFSIAGDPALVAEVAAHLSRHPETRP